MFEVIEATTTTTRHSLKTKFNALLILLQLHNFTLTPKDDGVFSFFYVKTKQQSKTLVEIEDRRIVEA